MRRGVADGNCIVVEEDTVGACIVVDDVGASIVAAALLLSTLIPLIGEEIRLAFAFPTLLFPLSPSLSTTFVILGVDMIVGILIIIYIYICVFVVTRQNILRRYVGSALLLPRTQLKRYTKFRTSM